MDYEQNQNAKVKKLGAIIFLVIAVIYCISPVDIIPDVIPIAGWIDDGGIIFAAIMLLKHSFAYAKAITDMQNKIQTTCTTSVNNKSAIESKAAPTVTNDNNKELDLF